MGTCILVYRMRCLLSYSRITNKRELRPESTFVILLSFGGVSSPVCIVRWTPAVIKCMRQSSMDNSNSRAYSLA
jgi:beta-lactamase class D